MIRIMFYKTDKIMTRSDEMMLSAIRLKVAMQMNGRDVSVEGDHVKVALHGVPAMVVRFDSGDVRVNGMLKVSRKSAKVLTNHPDGSYSLEKNDEGLYELYVKDIEKFWGGSRYLVVQVK